MLIRLYRKHLSPGLRKKIYKLFLGDALGVIRSRKTYINLWKYRIYYTFVEPKTEKEKALKTWTRAGRPSPYPYEWTKEYDYIMKETVHYDPMKSLYYVTHNNRKLYFRTGYDPHEIKAIYKNLLIEQDARCAHRYVGSYGELNGKLLFDTGAAEGIFTLDTIDYVDHAFLFECEEKWIEALDATFEPWKEKVTIIRKYVSDTDSGDYITLDTFCQSLPAKENIFLKMDIEGFEQKALNGCRQMLESAKDISGSVCIYHKQNDEKEIISFLRHYGYTTTVTPGYLYFTELRKAIVRFS